MKKHIIKVFPSRYSLPKTKQLAWKLAKVAVDSAPIRGEVVDMVINRIIDNAGVAMAAINQKPVANVRSMALAHPRSGGATIFGIPHEQTFCAQWAACANCAAVRELDFHDTFLAADYAHPGDNIAPLLAVAQQLNRSGRDLIRGIVVAYEIHIDLARGICLHEYKKDHIAHLCPATVAGIGALLQLDPDTIYQAIQQAVHTSFSTRQSRKGEISTWKAYAPAHSAKLAIEAVDRAMRGETSPSPIYEGEDGVIAWMLAGPAARYEVPLPETGEERCSILESYTKAHAAEYQAQALIDLAIRMGRGIKDFDYITEILIHTSHHTHHVIGSGANDPQKYDPYASRETLDHSIMYIFAVALQDGGWHHFDSYSRARATREDTVRLWKKIRTIEDQRWTDLYHHPDPHVRAFGGRVEIVFGNGDKLEEEIFLADAHPSGARPFGKNDYIHKFKKLTEDILTKNEADRFLELVQKLGELNGAQLRQLNISIKPQQLTYSTSDHRGIF